jgi:hypothetical protein
VRLAAVIRTTEHTRAHPGTATCRGCGARIEVGQRYLARVMVDERDHTDRAFALDHMHPGCLTLDSAPFWELGEHDGTRTTRGLDYVRRAYRMPWLDIGAKVATTAGLGTVTGCTAHVYVRLDGERRAAPYHPHDVQEPRMVRPAGRLRLANLLKREDAAHGRRARRSPCQ